MDTIFGAAPRQRLWTQSQTFLAVKQGVIDVAFLGSFTFAALILSAIQGSQLLGPIVQLGVFVALNPKEMSLWRAWIWANGLLVGWYGWVTWGAARYAPDLLGKAPDNPLQTILLTSILIGTLLAGVRFHKIIPSVH